MTWKLTEFGDTDLTVIFNRSEQVGTAPVSSRLIQTPSGWFDPSGAARTRPNAPVINLDGEIYDSDPLDQIVALAGRIGERDELTRTLSDGTEQTVYARLMACDIQHDWKNTAKIYPVHMTFEATGPWQGAAHEEGGTLNVSTGSAQVVLSNDGNINQESVEIEIYPTNVGGSLASVTITCEELGIDWVYTGSIGYLKKLVINSGNMSITNDGADAFSGLYLQSDHIIPSLFAIAPGEYTILIDITGSATEIKAYFYYNDAWA